jgi:2-dehydropantoate 2-reductase
MRYVIIGAGAIGGVLGARLAQNGKAVVLIARGDHGAAIRQHGLRLRTPDEDVTLRLDAAAGPDDVRLQAGDVLVLATKTHQAEAALLQWVDQPVFDSEGVRQGTAGESIPIFIAMNGVETERLALRLFARVFAICVWMPAVHLEPGEVISRIAPTSGIFIVGRFGSTLDERDNGLLAALDHDWSASTFTVHVVDDAMRWKYSKLVSNLGNGVQALLGAGADSGSITDRLGAEAHDLYRSAGIDWASEDEEAAWRGDVFSVRQVPGTPDSLGGSSWQSLQRGGGTIETDYLNGEIVLIARAMGRTAPLNETIQRLSRQAAAAETFVPMTLVELERELGHAAG